MNYNDPFYSRYYEQNLTLMKKDFSNFANKQSNTIQVEGMEKMGRELGIDIYTDLFITFFFYKCSCKSIEEVTEAEYITGLRALSCNNLREVKSQIEKVKELLLDIESDEFRQFYVFLFNYNVIKKTKLIPIEVVEIYFENLFESFGVTRKLITYLKNEKKVQGLSKDQWECALDFFINHGSTFPTEYNVAEYYPVLFDEFYNWFLEKEKKV